MTRASETSMHGPRCEWLCHMPTLHKGVTLDDVSGVHADNSTVKHEEPGPSNATLNIVTGDNRP